MKTLISLIAITTVLTSCNKPEPISGKNFQRQPGVPIKRRINTAANQGSIQSLSNAAITYGVLTAVAIGGIIVATSNTNSSHSH